MRKIIFLMPLPQTEKNTPQKREDFFIVRNFHSHFGDKKVFFLVTKKVTKLCNENFKQWKKSSLFWGGYFFSVWSRGFKNNFQEINYLPIVGAFSVIVANFSIMESIFPSISESSSLCNNLLRMVELVMDAKRFSTLVIRSSITSREAFTWSSGRRSAVTTCKNSCPLISPQQM